MELTAPLKAMRSAEQWQAFLDSWFRKTQMAASLTDPDGSIILNAGDDRRSPVCTKVRERKETLSFVCSQTNTAMTAMLKTAKEPLSEICEAGMQRNAVPILRDGELIGQVTLCGKTIDPEEVDPFMLAQTLGISEKEAEALAETAEVVSEEELESLMEELAKELYSI